MNGKIVSVLKAVGRLCLLCSLLSLLVVPALSPLSASSGSGSGESPPSATFNRDGYADLAVGVPHEDVETLANAGAVNVLYSSSTGLSATGDQIWHQDSTDIDGIAQGGDWFGYALTAGDFNGDGYIDLAVGVPSEAFGSPEVENTGAVNVLYGSPTGFSATGNQWWHQDSPGIMGVAQAEDGFGSALAAGDFDGDGYADLAVGVPFEDTGSPAVGDSGAVNILYGSPTGLTDTGDQMWYQDSTGIVGVAQAGDEFGSALAAGDFDGDGYADLAVGVPSEDTGSPAVTDSGAVNILHGSSTGLSATGDQIWYQDSPGIESTAWEDELFGSALATGDFDGDGYADLAVGVRGDSIGVLGGGAVNILYGSSTGLSATGNQWWHQDSSDIEDVAEAGDQFGSALAAGDFNGDGYADLAVGVPLEDIGSQGVADDAGAVNVLYGSSAGLSATGNQWWHQDSPGIIGVAQLSDWFGSALAAGDFDGDNYADLAVGVPFEDVGNPAVEDAGVVNVMYGSSTGLTGTGDQMWYQDSPDIEDAAQAGDRFGFALVTLGPVRHQVFCPLILRSG